MENIENESAVKIAIRERPFVPSENILKNERIKIQYTSIDKILIVENRPFAFDHVLGPDVSQEDLYNELIQPLVSKALEGFHCTAFAYGQTGTGKTYTMGLHGLEGHDAGMISRALDDIFAQSNFSNDDSEIEISVAYIEIYNEKVYDLLSERYTEPVNTKGCKFAGGTKRIVTCPMDGKKILLEGNKNRHVRSTKMNPCSSRSHAIFTLYINVTNANNRVVSAFNLVDLAGTEGVRRTGHQGIALAEGVHINQGLLCVSKVLQALSTGNKVIPYRDSILSTVLQDSLNLNSYLTLLACISPSKSDLSETLTTLRFAQNAKSLKNQPQINAILADIKKQIRTPQKSVLPLRARNAVTPTPRKRKLTGFESSFTSLKKVPPSFRNTFCTPDKKRKLDWRPNFTLDMIKNKNSILHPDEIDINGSEKSFDSQSIWSLNMSSSTAIEAIPPVIPVSASQSPLLKTVCDKMENIIDEKLKMFFETMQNTLMDQSNARKIIKTSTPEKTLTPKPHTPEIIVAENKISRTSEIWEIMKKQIPEIIRNEISQFVNTTNIEFSSYEKTVIEKNPDTTIFKKPDFPIRTVTRTVQNNHIINNEISVANETVVNFENQTNLAEIIATTPRRSVRLSVRRDSIQHEINTQEPRRSVRLSIRRDSIQPESLNNHLPKNNKNVTVKKGKQKKTPPTSVQVINDYFKSNSTNDKRSKSTKKNEHRVGVLKLINSGTMKELKKILPEIGLKKAYQIVTHRILNGNFKSFDDLAKLPVWKGKSWDRFMQANNLL